jgi:hypothetical protein
MGENSQTLNDVNDMENRSNQDCDNGIPAAFSQLNQNVNANFTSIFGFVETNLLLLF